MSNMRPAGRMSCVALMTTQMRPIWPSGDPQFDMPVLRHQHPVSLRTAPNAQHGLCSPELEADVIGNMHAGCDWTDSDINILPLKANSHYGAVPLPR
jgi:hypothetical protein